MANYDNSYPLLDASTTEDDYMVVPASGFQHATFGVDSASSANLTIKFFGSVSETKPDPTAAQTAANSFSYLKSTDLEDGSVINGNTGLVATGTDLHGMVNADFNGLRWIGVILSTHNSGSITVTARLFVNS